MISRGLEGDECEAHAVAPYARGGQPSPCHVFHAAARPWSHRRFDAHGVGVHTMAAWGDNSVQVYTCPVKCGEAHGADWTPCGAAAGVALAARIDGLSVMVAGGTVYVGDDEQACRLPMTSTTHPSPSTATHRP